MICDFAPPWLTHTHRERERERERDFDRADFDRAFMIGSMPAELKTVVIVRKN